MTPTRKSAPNQDWRRPLTGCFRCPATDHYASNLQFHPKETRDIPLTDATKKAIMARIDAADLTPTLKSKEKKKRI